jgi:murein DD-endopeptidase MepM/ murein hydrolase activator NlpD
MVRAARVEKPRATAVAARAAVDTTAELRAVVDAPRRAQGGRRSAPRKSLIRGLPSAPILLGVAALAVSAGGAVTVADPQLVGSDTPPAKIIQAGALSGTGGVASSVQPGARGPIVSRDASRDQQTTPEDAELAAAAEQQVKELEEARADANALAAKQDAKIKLNLWTLPVQGYHLTARFGQYGLWSSYHTGLDFAAPSGTPIYAVANGVISSASYDGAYGNKTVQTLDDGTEIWYCHQTSYIVSSGETVHAGELIGYTGSTGHVTGPHLHLEVRPGGGDPVDPYSAFQVHGVTP